MDPDINSTRVQQWNATVERQIGTDWQASATVDLAVSRMLSLGVGHTIELRVETFNLFNNFNCGNPNTNFAAGTFGRITSQSGDPRIMQFGVKHGF